MTGSVRLLNLGKINPVRSQTCYHAVAYAMTPESSDTILLVTPSKPYVSIGYHQDPWLEVDIDYCQANHLPIVRREVGGGAVYLDEGQVFIQWIFQSNHLPATLAERFALYIQPILETYQSLGIQANLRPVNDIHINGKKIGGTGAAQIGSAQIVVGSLMFDFDKKTMSQVLKLSSKKMRDKVFQSLEEYMTTVREQLGYIPDIPLVIRTYIQKSEAVLQRKLTPGYWSQREETEAASLDRAFSSEAWLYLKSGLNRSGVKIHSGVSVGESQYKAAGGLIRTIVRLQGDCIDDISISGDFTIFPASVVTRIENGITGKPATLSAVQKQIHQAYSDFQIQSPGMLEADLANAVMDAVERGKAINR